MSVKLLLLSILPLLACTLSESEAIQFKKTAYYFDAGGNRSDRFEDYVHLKPADVYTPEKGYGWLDGKALAFENERADRSRDAFLMDGIQSEDISFKADLPNGDWWFTLWFDSGYEDSVTTKLFLMGEGQDLEIQAFNPPAEPRSQIMLTYRVIQKKVKVTDEGFTFRLKGVGDKAYLLGFSLIPAEEKPKSETETEIYNSLREIGELKNSTSFSEIENELSSLKKNPESSNFASYWLQQIQLQKKAEMFFEYRGWSWATQKTGMGLFDHLNQSVMLYDGILNHPDATDSPLYDRALWYRGRLLYWLWLERGGENEARSRDRDLAALLRLHPDDELVRMYNGEKINSPDEFDNVLKPKNSPDWAFYQWELSNRLKKAVDWWVLEKQDENGEFGGKFGDDVEILRWWSPLILSGDSVTYKGWKKLADGVWNSFRIKDGYAKKPSDVEHSSEFISDTAPLMVLYNDDPEYINRLAYSARHFTNLWTDYNNEGYRHYKSAWFSSSEVEMDPPKNRDVSYNARATKAVRYYLWKTGDEGTRTSLIEWADAWLAATRSTEKAKPKWIVPPSVEFPSGKINGDEPTWYKANMYWDYFDWGGSTAILDQFLFTWTFTKDEKYLEPIIESLKIIERYQSVISQKTNSSEIGSIEWAAFELGNSSSFWNVIENWRLLTDDSSFDDLILKYGTPFIKYRLTKEEDYLMAAMQPYLDKVRYNEPMISTEVIHTDRVFIKEGRVRDASVLQGMITGFGVNESSSPYIAVSWENASRDLTFLVTDSHKDELHVNVFSYADYTEDLVMRLWQLEKGDYVLNLKSKNRNEVIPISVTKKGERIGITFEAGLLTQISVMPTSAE
jgi:hypothetical protein